MTDAEETYYTKDRWQNWLTRVEEEELDPENEDSARLLLNLQDDAAIAVAKIVSAYEEDTLSEEDALDELEGVRDIVLSEPTFEGDDVEEKVMLIDGVQTSLVCVFYAAEEYIVAGPAEAAPLEEYVTAAAEAEQEENMDAALGYLVQAGTRIIEGDELDMSIAEELEYGLVSEWLNGLDSLQSAMSDPEVVEEDEE
ncbi:DUF2150 family protein [Halogeometricum borinquense]|uniref:Uncharacterized conserved protein n=2 Tax=Halogeometricum borinquense TaxID=60847 RepID=E4NP15_HALBP|nr:DUF2150 family protein [Halogeometricum borinquense]ADQ66446.1 uncharacterized conserved protein [Halogeometricum borinquense DSM 11551]ELY31166.1 hypothetical protein C499_01780 [Halogeometricum borinquense DSM 11551]QIB75253.1 DUF2150 family protein [Halogeometricum borinquense]QIQ75802.1 DUF2150 family protein [Halogeometricum borinquense]RYJ15159.1 DUF2150 family protein [Halogeometricum borinquense]